MTESQPQKFQILWKYSRQHIYTCPNPKSIYCFSILWYIYSWILHDISSAPYHKISYCLCNINLPRIVILCNFYWTENWIESSGIFTIISVKIDQNSILLISKFWVYPLYIILLIQNLAMNFAFLFNLYNLVIGNLRAPWGYYVQRPDLAIFKCTRRVSISVAFYALM